MQAFCTATDTSVWEQRLAGLATGCTAVGCLIIDAGVAYVQQRLRPLHGCFAILYKSMVVTECANLALYALFVAPVLFSADESLASSFGSRRAGHLFLLLWNTVIFLMIAIAINRYLAICYPTKYSQWCTRKAAVRGVVLCYAMAVINTAGYLFEDCDFLLSVRWLGYVFSSSQCGRLLWWHCAVSCTLGTAVLLALNMSTFMALKRQNMLKRALHVANTLSLPTVNPIIKATLSADDIKSLNGCEKNVTFRDDTQLTPIISRVNWQSERRASLKGGSSECVLLATKQSSSYRSTNGTSVSVRFSENQKKLSPTSIWKDRYHRMRQKKKLHEIRFFIQSALNALCFEGTVISYHLFSKLCPSPWGLFLLGNLPLIITHGTNGLIMLLVNPELRRAIGRRLSQWRRQP